MISCVLQWRKISYFLLISQMQHVESYNERIKNVTLQKTSKQAS